jgi:two-component system, sensor histidine kinase LadS
MAAQFKTPSDPAQALNFGLSDAAYWLRLSLHKAPNNTDDWLIELSYALLNQITFYAPGMSPVVTGSDYPIATRAFYDKYFIFPIQLHSEDQDFYFRIASQNAITVPLRAWSMHELIPRTQKTMAIQFTYFGAMLGLAFYTLVMYLMSRDKRYGLYAAYVLCLALSMTAGSGVAGMFFWPDAFKFDSNARNLFLASAASIMLYLSGLFLKIEYGKPKVAWGWKLGSLYFGVYVLLMLLGLWLPVPTMWMNKAMLWGGGLSGVLILGVIAKVIRERRRSLQLFCLAWLVFWMGGFVGIARTVGWLPTHFLTSYAVQIASMSEMLLLFMALADQFRQEQVRRLSAQQAANMDTLTGLWNRRHFHEMVIPEMEKANRYGLPLSLINFDIDHFKAINDTHGHLVGDRVLVEMSHLTRQLIRSTDLLFRWGGEEFFLLLPHTGQEDALAVAEKLRRAFASHPMTPVGTVTASFGVAVYEPHQPLDLWINRADHALYEAKNSGRNRVKISPA